MRPFRKDDNHTASLHDFVKSVNGTSHLRIEHDFGDGFVRLQTSEAERRQAAQDIQCSENIVLELLRNSRDAHAKNIYVAMSRDGSKRHLTVIDDGDGIPKNMHGLVFEPRVTSKLDSSHMDAWGLHGRGMALYSISVNSEYAAVTASDVNRGTSIRVRTDVGVLPERTDQSSFPTFELTEKGKVNVRGPRNILRTACEFAIDSRSCCAIYIGSPAEVCATLYAYGTETLSTIERIFCDDIESLPLIKRLATCADPESLQQMAALMGLDMSTRTARRIIDGEVNELDPVLDRISIEPSAQGKASKKKKKPGIDNRGLKLTPQDRQMLATSLGRSFEDIATKYYLDANVDPSVRVTRDKIIVTVPIVHKL